MLFRLKATALSRGFPCASLGSLQGWQQPQFCSYTSLLRSLAHCCLPLSYRSGATQVGKASLLTGFLLPENDGVDTYWEVQKGGAMAVERKFSGVGREAVLCMPHSIENLSRNRVERVLRFLLSAIPSRSFHNTNSLEPEGGVPSQALLLDTRAPNVTGKTEEGLSRDSRSSLDSPDGHHRCKGRGRQRLPCEYEGCKVKYSNFGFPEEDGRRCYRHRLLGMVPLYRACEAPGCITQAVFGFPGENKGAWCMAHKLKGMVNRKYPACNEPECTRPAVYGAQGEKSPSVCRDHVVEGMIPIYHAPNMRCRSPGCMSHGIYAHSLDKRHRFCFEHKSDSMVSLGGSRCEEEGCTTFASFGWPDMGVWLRCGEHKKKGMVGKVRCTAEGCTKEPSFGYPLDKTRLRCKAHMEKDMVDLHHKRMCDAPECKKKGWYALPGERASRCGKHKGAEMVNVVRKLCGVSECNRVAEFGLAGQARTRCSRHKEQGMSKRKQRLEMMEAGTGLQAHDEVLLAQHEAATSSAPRATYDAQDNGQVQDSAPTKITEQDGVAEGEGASAIAIER